MWILPKNTTISIIYCASNAFAEEDNHDSHEYDNYDGDDEDDYDIDFDDNEMMMVKRMIGYDFKKEDDVDVSIWWWLYNDDYD